MQSIVDRHVHVNTGAYFITLTDDFVMVTAIEEGDKVKAEITSILYKEQIKYIQENNMWWVLF